MSRMQLADALSNMLFFLGRDQATEVAFEKQSEYHHNFYFRHVHE